MRETRADTRRALLEALVLHALLFVLLFAGLNWSRDRASDAAAGEPIEAELVDPGSLSAEMQRALRRDAEPLPQPVPEPEPQPAPLPAPDEDIPEPLPEPTPAQLPPPVPEPAPVEQERVRRDAASPDVAKVPREQEAKRMKPDQADLDAQREQRAEREKQRKIEELKRQREQAARERTQAEMRAQQLADARAGGPARLPAGDPASNSSKRAEYSVALMNAILRQWTRPDSVQLGQVCQVLIRQLPGGEVVDVEVAPSCPYDALGRRSVEAAIRKASPLPYAGFEDVFVRDPVLRFRAEDL